jgi:hypothetical protein
VFGSDDDIASGLARFATIPDGIPTPLGSSLEAFTVEYFADPAYFVASSSFSSSATADDLAIFYQTMLTAAGFELSDDDAQDGVRSIVFANGTSDYADASVGVVIDTSDGVDVRLEISDAADPAVLEAFTGWPAGMPAIEDGHPVAASISATRDSQITLLVSTTFAFDDVTAEQLTTRVRDAIAANDAGGFHLAADDAGGATISLQHVAIESPSAVISTMSTAGTDVTTLELSGSLSL